MELKWFWNCMKTHWTCDFSALTLAKMRPVLPLAAFISVQSQSANHATCIHVISLLRWAPICWPKCRHGLRENQHIGEKHKTLDGNQFEYRDCTARLSWDVTGKCCPCTSCICNVHALLHTHEIVPLQNTALPTVPETEDGAMLWVWYRWTSVSAFEALRTRSSWDDDVPLAVSTFTSLLRLF